MYKGRVDKEEVIVLGWVGVSLIWEGGVEGEGGQGGGQRLVMGRKKVNKER